MNKQNHIAAGAASSAKAKHTPGPWKVVASHHRVVVFTDEDEMDRIIVAEVSLDDDDPHNAVALADAKLIAQAPTVADRAAELIDACPGACGCTSREQDSGHRADCWRPRLDAAVDALADALRAAGRIP